MNIYVNNGLYLLIELLSSVEGDVIANGVKLVELDVRLTNAIVHHINGLLCSSSSSSPSSSAVLSFMLLSGLLLRCLALARN